MPPKKKGGKGGKGKAKKGPGAEKIAPKDWNNILQVQMGALHQKKS